jgi:PAS domain S-box-containing protein
MITRRVGISTSIFPEVNLPLFISKHKRRYNAKVRPGLYVGQRHLGSQRARDRGFHPVRYDGERRGAAPTPKSLLLLLVFYLLFQLPALAQAKGTHRVLIANEVSPLSPRIAAIDRQIATDLGKVRCQAEFCVENPEASQFPPKATQKHTRDWYIRRYRDRKPDLIMALGLSPIGFMIDWEPSRVSTVIASKILRGEKPQEILTLRSAHSHLFDWQALDHVRFKEDTVAVGISLLNEWPGFWQAYNRHILAGFVVLLAQTFLIMSLLLERRKRKKAGAELLHVNTQLRLAMESGKSVGWEWDLVRDEITWFGDLRTMFGMASETFVCTLGDFFGYVHPEDRKGVAEAIADAQRSHKPYAEEFRVVRADGNTRWVGSRGSFEYAPNGEAKRAVGMAVDITDQKQIEQSLRDSQNRLHCIVESAMDAIIAIDEDMRIVLFNAAAERMFGCTARDALGSRFERFIPQRFATAHGAHVRAFAETSATNLAMRGVGVLWAVRANGEEFRIEASISQHEIAGQKIFTAIVRDVTERVKAEEVQGRLAAIVHSSEDAIISLSLDGIIESWNPGAQRMYGYSEAEAIGHSIMLMVPPEFQEEETDLLRRMTRGEVIEHRETVRLTKTGRRITVLLSESALRDSGGEIVGASKIVRDITERKHAEQALRESEERFRLVANTAPVMIWMSDADKLCTYLNEPWLAFTGRSLQQELGNGWTEGVHSDDLSGIWKIFETAFDKREPFRMEYRLRRHDGEYHWISAQGVPRFDSDGCFAGYIGSCTDITERRVAQEALSGMSRKLIEAHEQERAWIARELHDNINQEIGLLAVNLDRVKQELSPLSPANSRRFKDIHARIVALGSDVQALSHRLHSSKLEYLGLAAAASSLCRELSEQHEVQIDFRSESMPEELSEAISLCLFRVLQEALQNAIKHSGTQRFEVSLRGKANSIELTVRDWGIGFSPVKAMENRGLGLTSMSERLKLVDGDLYIDLPAGGGTLVGATVPLSISQRAAGA